MRVLVACEREGRVRDAFRLRGHDAWSCDLEPGEGEYKRYHYRTDVRNVLHDSWDLLIAHPPCTFLANSGVRWLYEDDSRWDKLADAIKLFVTIKAAPVPLICIENPIPHRFAVEGIRYSQGIGRYDQLIQPWQFGHPESKATCLWLRGLPKLVPTKIVPGPYAQRCWRMAPGPERARERSKTYWGIADAMASQWGGHNGR